MKPRTCTINDGFCSCINQRVGGRECNRCKDGFLEFPNCFVRKNISPVSNSILFSCLSLMTLEYDKVFKALCLILISHLFSKFVETVLKFVTFMELNLIAMWILVEVTENARLVILVKDVKIVLKDMKL